MQSPAARAFVVCLSWLAATHASASPVEKVVKLLTELKERIGTDGDKEQQVYDRYACWCEQTSARKASSIEAARASLRSLGQDILSLKGKAATLEAEVKKLLADIKENEEAQATATAIRSKENAAFMAESAEMKQALEALERAAKVLQSAMPSLLQQGAAGAASRRALGASLQAALEAVPASGSGVVPGLREAAAALAQADSRYAPQSATIQGILQEMYKTFGTDLEAKTQSEATSNKNYEALMATKQEELATMQELVTKKNTEKAEAEKMMAESAEAYDDTEAQLKADVDFFDSTKAACTAKSDEWSQRSTLRAEELAGISKALEILSSDDARELFGKTIKPGHGTLFLQLRSARANSAPAQLRKRQAFKALKEKASGVHSLRLARFAATVSVAEVGHFDKVIEAIDKMLETLKEEGADDISKRDECKEEYKEINSTISELDWKVEKNDAKIAKLAALIEAKEAEKAQTIIDIADTKKQITSMTEQRKQENAAFLQAKSEDEDAIKLLTDAKAALADYFQKHAKALLQMQRRASPEFEVSADQAPEAKFSGKGSRGLESKGVIEILGVIVEDLEGEIATSTKAEETAQLKFEDALKAAQTLQKELEDKEVALEGLIAERNEDKTDEGAKKTANVEEHGETVDYKKSIKPDCDWIIGAFEKRAQKRQAEADGLTQAKEFLAGHESQDASALAQRGATARRSRAAGRGGTHLGLA